MWCRRSLTLARFTSSAPLSCATTGITPAVMTMIRMVPLPLCTPRRYQRSSSVRPRTSTWQEKAAKYEKQEKVKRESTAPGRRKRFFSSVSQTSTNSDSYTPSEPAPPPARSIWRFLVGPKSKGTFRAPYNPLHKESTVESKYDPSTRTTSRMLLALQELKGRQLKRGKDDPLVQLSDEEKRTIVNRYVGTRWYARLYRPFRNVTERQTTWTIRICNTLLIIIGVLYFVIFIGLYKREMTAFSLLSEEDQRDYVHIVMGMRYSDIVTYGSEVLAKEDPLDALPLQARMHIVIDACREKGWTTVDWDTELRKMHPLSALEELDYVHLLYWAIMYTGNLTTGGGAMFTDRYDSRMKVKENENKKQESYVDVAPMTEEESKRGFFS